MSTGRTPAKFCNVCIEDSGGTMRDIPVSSVNGVGITYEEQDVSALQDALKSALIGQGAVNISLTGPFDTTAAATAATTGNAPSLSGSHTVLAALNGGQTPRAFSVKIGIRGHWASGDPAFTCNGATSTAGFTVSDYQFDPSSGYSAKLTLYPGSVPAWGTATATT